MDVVFVPKRECSYLSLSPQKNDFSSFQDEKSSLWETVATKGLIIIKISVPSNHFERNGPLFL